MDLETAIEKNNEQQAVLINLMSAGYLEPEIFHMEKNQLLIEADELSKEKDRISKSINGDLLIIKNCKVMVNTSESKVRQQIQVKQRFQDGFAHFI